MKLQCICSHFRYILLFVCLACTSNFSYAEEIKSEHIYRSPEERREAGLQTEITDWLTFSGLIEVEWARDLLVYGESTPDVKILSNVEALQLGFEASFFDELHAVLVLELEHDEDNKIHSAVDEAVLVIEVDDFEIEAGRLTLPFGEYYSHFISDPLLAFGEKRNDGIVLTYEVSDAIDSAVFAAGGNAAKPDGDKIDWGFNIELRNTDESIKASIGYLSDLADTDELLLQDNNNRYQKRIAALNANLLIGFKSFEITAEYVAALGSFLELPAESDHPAAFNIELAYFPTTDIQIAFRTELSRELEDAPKRQVGISATFIFLHSMTFTVEYLSGKFKQNFVQDDDDKAFDKTTTLVGRLTYAF